jgi:hypothetical protein
MPEPRRWGMLVATFCSPLNVPKYRVSDLQFLILVAAGAPAFANIGNVHGLTFTKREPDGQLVNRVSLVNVRRHVVSLHELINRRKSAANCMLLTRRQKVIEMLVQLINAHVEVLPAIARNRKNWCSHRRSLSTSLPMSKYTLVDFGNERRIAKPNRIDIPSNVADVLNR